MAKLFHFTMQFYPEDKEMYPQNRYDHGLVTEHGLIAGNTYGDAANTLVKYYGEENVLEVSLYECENPLCMDDIAGLVEKEPY